MFFGLMTASTLVRTKNRQSPVRLVSDKLANINRIILDPFAVPGNERPHSKTNKIINNIVTTLFQQNVKILHTESSFVYLFQELLPPGTQMK